MKTITVYEARNIAKVMVASTGMAFDGGAFEKCDDVITEEDQQLIIDEIQKFCESIIIKVSDKIGRDIE